MKTAIRKRMKSKTYWLGAVTLALGVLETAQATGLVPQLFSEQQRALVTITIAVLIFILREITTNRITDK